MNITFDNVSFKYIEKLLLNGVSFSLTDNDKVGFIGVNGTGKSTLLKLLLGVEKPISGTITISGGMIINYLPQDILKTNGESGFEIVMSSSTKEHPINDYEARSILTKLKINPDASTTNMSGGELKRIALARALVSYSDFLILDEPTNHLDNDMIMWLEKYLIKYNHGLLMVTHDRYFLERICNKMLELDFGKTYLYEANYSKFLDLKAERLNNEIKAQQKLKSILKNEHEWLDRGCEARRTKSKNRIEKIKALEEIEFNSHDTFEFNSINTRLGKELIEIENGSKYFGDKVLFENFSFKLERNDIIGVVGANGAGKSTLFKIIMGQEELTQGKLIKGQTLKIGYFSQTLDTVDENIRVIDYIKETASVIETINGTLTASQLLEQFLFNKELQYSKISTLSGGERRRLQLIRVLINNPNLLILDEPTNDLDIYTLEILEDYLMSFNGPILIVSHDRYFLDKLCNKLFAFENNNINQYQISFTEYLKKEVVKETKDKEVKVRVKNKMSSKDRNLLDQLNKEIPMIEEELGILRNKLSKLTTEFTEIMEITEKINNLEEDLDNKINKLFELEELKESYTI